jgi:hypothetical protein
MSEGSPAEIRRTAVALLPRTYLEPDPTPGFHLHPLPRLATVAGVVVATDAGTPGAKERARARGMDSIPDEGPGMTAAGVSAAPNGGKTAASIRAPATAQEGEAAALLHHVLATARQGHAVWIVVDSEAAAQSLQTYLKGRKTGGAMKDLYAQHLDGQDILLTTSINVVVTPSHRVTHVNRWADEETKQPPATRGDWILRRHFAFVPPTVSQDHYQLGPRELHAWGQRRILADGVEDHGSLSAHNEARFDGQWKPGRGIPLAWVPGRLQKHVLQQRVAGLPTMVEFDRRLSYKGNPTFDSVCPLCGRHPEDEFHAWRCTRTARHALRFMDGLANWLEEHAYMGRPGARLLEDEVRDPLCLVMWATATKTQGLITDKLGTATRDALGTRFLLKAIDFSARLWKIRYQLRDKVIQERHGMSMAAYVKTFRGRDRTGEDEAEEDSDDDSAAGPGEQGQGDIPHMMDL